VRVEFPAYSLQIEQVRDALRREGFDSDNLAISGAFARKD